MRRGLDQTGKKYGTGNIMSTNQSYALLICAQNFEFLTLNHNFKSISYEETKCLSQNIQAAVITWLFTQLHDFNRAKHHKQPVIYGGRDLSLHHHLATTLLYHSIGWNFGLVRILSPYLSKSHDPGANPTAIRPSKVLPHPSPNRLYSEGPANGITAPKIDLTMVFAAIALAA